MTEQFKPYLESPHKVEYQYTSKGPFSFLKHIGQKLGNDLWDDIIYNLKPKHMLIYKAGSWRTPLTTIDSLTIIVEEGPEGFIIKDMVYQGSYQ